MAGEVDERAWQELSGQVQGELAAWRRAHPRATLTEIEAATATALQRLQARYLRDLVAASPSADLAATPPRSGPAAPSAAGRWKRAGGIRGRC